MNIDLGWLSWLRQQTVFLQNATRPSLVLAVLYMTTGTWFFGQNYADWCTSIIRKSQILTVYIWRHFSIRPPYVFFLSFFAFLGTHFSLHFMFRDAPRRWRQLATSIRQGQKRKNLMKASKALLYTFVISNQKRFSIFQNLSEYPILSKIWLKPCQTWHQYIS